MKTATNLVLFTITLAFGAGIWLATSWQSDQVDRIITMMDVDKNGAFQSEELSPLMRLRISELDGDGNGGLDRSAVAAYIRSSIFNVVRRTWRARGLPACPDSVGRNSLQVALDELPVEHELLRAGMPVGDTG